MMKNFKKPLIAVLSTTVALAGLFSLGACNGSKPLTDEPLNATKIADYTKTAEDRKETFASGSKGYSWENGEPFNVWWKPQNVSYEGGKMSLSISEMAEKEQKWDEEKQENVDVVADYYGAEERSEHYYGYGDFQVRMKPSNIAGTASTFFTCTGPYDKWYSEDGTEVIKENKHDEIDIEFLGKDTTKVQFNYFVNGQGGHEYMYNLGFDASVEFHDYGYRWTDSYITWFVDSTPVYRVDRKGDEAWPSHPGRIIMNYWCATESASAWMGEFKEDYSGKAEYEYVATSATQCPDPNTAHIKDTPVTPPEEIEVPTEGWTDIDYSSFGGWSGYDIDKTNGLTISHNEKKKDWACEGMDLADSYSWIKFNLKNNADVAADIRMDIKDNGNSVNAVEAVSPANENVKVTADSVGFIHIDANAEFEVAFKLKNVFVDQFVIFLNSTPGAEAEKGSITITGLKGIISGDVEKPEPVEKQPVKIGTNEVTFVGDYNGITVSEDGTAMTIEYADVLGNSYKNANTGIADIVGNNNVLSFTVKNNGTETVKIRMDIGCDAADGTAKTEGGEKDEKNNFCNIKAEYTGTVVASGNDYDWGGADWVQIAADETVTVKITFTKGVAKDIKFYLDSSTWDDETTHSGNVTFSAFALTEEEVASPNPPQPSGDGTTAIDINGFDGWGKYTVDKTNGITISHDDDKKEKYDCCGMDLSSDYGIVKFTVKNNSETEGAVIKIDVKEKDAAKGGVKTVTVTSGGGEHSYAYYNDYDDSAVIIIEAGGELEITITVNDKVTVSQFVVFLNSTGDAAATEGSITIKDLRGAAKTTEE